MKDLQGRASASVSAAPETARALLADVAAYPRWYPDVVRQAEVVEQDADGLARRARVVLHFERGPLTRDFRLLFEVSHDASAVTLVRVPHEPSDPERFSVSWRVSPESEGSRLELALDAALDVPRLLPLGGIGDAMAGGFVAAAVRELERS